MNTSATGGYLLPDGGALTDETLEDALQLHVVGITGLPGDLVRPRWARVVPKVPEPTVTWAALGIKSVASDASPLINQLENNTEVIRHQLLNVLITFYGPQGSSFATLFRDGLAIPQNNQQLKTINASLIDYGEVLAVPELVNQQWVKRFDIAFRLRHKTRRIYQIKPILVQPDINLAKE